MNKKQLLLTLSFIIFSQSAFGYNYVEGFNTLLTSVSKDKRVLCLTGLGTALTLTGLYAVKKGIDTYAWKEKDTTRSWSAWTTKQVNAACSSIGGATATTAGVIMVVFAHELIDQLAIHLKPKR